MLWSNFNNGLNLVSLFFFGMFIHDNEFETMGSKIWTKKKIEHNTYTLRDLGYSSNLIAWLALLAISDLEVIFTGD